MRSHMFIYFSCYFDIDQGHSSSKQIEKENKPFCRFFFQCKNNRTYRISILKRLQTLCYSENRIADVTIKKIVVIIQLSLQFSGFHVKAYESEVFGS